MAQGLLPLLLVMATMVSGLRICSVHPYTMECYDGAAWTRAPAMHGRDHFAVNTFNGSICAIGGTGTNDDYSNQFQDAACFNGVNWVASPPFSWEKYNAKSATYQGMMCLLGGAFDQGEPSAQVECFNGTHWKLLPLMSTERSYHAAAEFRGPLCVMGGIQASSTAVSDPTVECFDGSVWQRLPDMIVARHSLTVQVVKGRLCAFGGVTNRTTPLSSVECFDGIKWTMAAPMRVPRFRAASIALDGKACVAGGYHATDGAVVSVTVGECFDGETWTPSEFLSGREFYDDSLSVVQFKQGPMSEVTSVFSLGANFRYEESAGPLTAVAAGVTGLTLLLIAVNAVIVLKRKRETPVEIGVFNDDKEETSVVRSSASIFVAGASILDLLLSFLFVANVIGWTSNFPDHPSDLGLLATILVVTAVISLLVNIALSAHGMHAILTVVLYRPSPYTLLATPLCCVHLLNFRLLDAHAFGLGIATTKQALFDRMGLLGYIVQDVGPTALRAYITLHSGVMSPTFIAGLVASILVLVGAVIVRATSSKQSQDDEFTAQTARKASSSVDSVKPEHPADIEGQGPRLGPVSPNPAALEPEVVFLPQELKNVRELSERSYGPLAGKLDTRMDPEDNKSPRASVKFSETGRMQRRGSESRRPSISAWDGEDLSNRSSRPGDLPSSRPGRRKSLGDIAADVGNALFGPSQDTEKSNHDKSLRQIAPLPADGAPGPAAQRIHQRRASAPALVQSELVATALPGVDEKSTMLTAEAAAPDGSNRTRRGSFSRPQSARGPIAATGNLLVVRPKTAGATRTGRSGASLGTFTDLEQGQGLHLEQGQGLQFNPFGAPVSAPPSPEHKIQGPPDVATPPKPRLSPHTSVDPNFKFSRNNDFALGSTAPSPGIPALTPRRNSATGIPDMKPTPKVTYTIRRGSAPDIFVTPTKPPNATRTKPPNFDVEAAMTQELARPSRPGSAGIRIPVANPAVVVLSGKPVAPTVVPSASPDSAVVLQAKSKGPSIVLKD